MRARFFTKQRRPEGLFAYLFWSFVKEQSVLLQKQKPSVTAYEKPIVFQRTISDSSSSFESKISFKHHVVSKSQQIIRNSEVDLNCLQLFRIFFFLI